MTIKAKTPHELLRQYAGRRRLFDGRRWGNWRFKESDLTLEYASPRKLTPYYIDLERMDTSAVMLDWIFQINQKGWASVNDLGQLIRALNDIFEPQATLCSSGISKRINSSAYLKARLSDSKKRMKKT